jgi:hypothetical protein
MTNDFLPIADENHLSVQSTKVGVSLRPEIFFIDGRLDLSRERILMI